jgi:hypothetical protein
MGYIDCPKSCISGRIYGLRRGPFGSQSTSEYSYPRSLGSMKSIQASQINEILGAGVRCAREERGERRGGEEERRRESVLCLQSQASPLIPVPQRLFTCRCRGRRNRRGQRSLPASVPHAKACQPCSFPTLVSAGPVVHYRPLLPLRRLSPPI